MIGNNGPGLACIWVDTGTPGPTHGQILLMSTRPQPRTVHRGLPACPNLSWHAVGDMQSQRVCRPAEHAVAAGDGQARQPGAAGGAPAGAGPREVCPSECGCSTPRRQAWRRASKQSRSSPLLQLTCSMSGDSGSVDSWERSPVALLSGFRVQVVRVGVSHVVPALPARSQSCGNAQQGRNVQLSCGQALSGLSRPSAMVQEPQCGGAPWKWLSQ